MAALLWPVGLAATVGFIAAYDWLVLGRGGARIWPAVVAAASLPFWIPAAMHYPRIVCTVVAVVLAAKSLERGRGRFSDPAMQQSVGRFLAWLALPPDSTFPPDPAAAARARCDGRRRIGRAALKAPMVWALLQALELHPGLPWIPIVGGLWAGLVTYVAVSGITDVVSGLAMQSGVYLHETFDAPPLARSPRDFWGRRWNLYIHRFALRNVFTPLGGRRRPFVAMAAVFLASGLMHEYFIVAALGKLGSYPGLMLSYFVLQGAAVMIQGALERVRPRRLRLPAPMAVAAHTIWMAGTAPLFFAPLSELFPG